MRMCYEQNDYIRAHEVYENIKSRGIALNSQCKRTYVTLLYNQKHYSKILDVFNTITNEKRHEDYLLVIAALHQLGTENAYNEAVKIVQSFKDTFSHSFPRIELILAWLGIKLNKFEPAITQ